MDFILDIVPPCILHKFTNMYCPGCGGTRGFVALTHGQILKSVYYHPFILYVVVCFAWYFLKQATKAVSRGRLNIPMPKPTTFVNVAAVVVIVNWIIRNVLYIGWGIAIY